SLTFHLRIAVLLDLRQPLVLNIRADADELDHLFSDAQATFDLLHQLAGTFQCEKDVETVDELADDISKTTLAHLLRALHGSTRGGDIRLQIGDQLIDVLVALVRTNNEHHFICTLHLHSPGPQLQRSRSQSLPTSRPLPASPVCG